MAILSFIGTLYASLSFTPYVNEVSRHWDNSPRVVPASAHVEAIKNAGFEACYIATICAFLFYLFAGERYRGSLIRWFYLITALPLLGFLPWGFFPVAAFAFVLVITRQTVAPPVAQCQSAPA